MWKKNNYTRNKNVTMQFGLDYKKGSSVQAPRNRHRMNLFSKSFTVIGGGGG